MFKLLRFTLTFSFTVALLSLTYEGKPLFNYLYKYSIKIVSPAQESAQNMMRIGYYRTLDFTRQIFNNNLPTRDSVDYQLSGPDRQRPESYSLEDEQKLNDIFGN